MAFLLFNEADVEVIAYDSERCRWGNSCLRGGGHGSDCFKEFTCEYCCLSYLAARGYITEHGSDGISELTNSISGIDKMHEGNSM